MLKPGSPSPNRCLSPAMSEISVGSPSPPPKQRYLPPSSQEITANSLHMKRNRNIHHHQANEGAQPHRKSSAERVKSFSIDHILGKKQEEDEGDSQSPNEEMSDRPGDPLLAKHPSLPAHLYHERLQPPPPPPAPPLPHALPSTQLLIESVPPVLAKVPILWDPSRSTAFPLHPLFPSPQFLHYDQRLAWDYQRQLQEHFQIQAQMLREMSMDPGIIPSEDGCSERSHSRSTGSNCCSPVDSSLDKTNDHSQNDDKSNESDPDHDEKSIGGSRKKANSANDTPLDALFQLSTKNFDEEQDPTTLNLFASRPNPKKKRKSRTAFTNHQIFELEKRFLYQKYLSPADRDEIAAALGLSNAQVITWFQNRRAKLKRDMEELKKDVESVKQLPGPSAATDLNKNVTMRRQEINYMKEQLYHIPYPYPPNMSTMLLQQEEQQHLQEFRKMQSDPKQSISTSMYHKILASPQQKQPQFQPHLPNQQHQAQQNHQQQQHQHLLHLPFQKEHQKSQVNHGTKSTQSAIATEDKKEIKFLKMLTLMHYSQQQHQHQNQQQHPQLQPVPQV